MVSIVDFMSEMAFDFSEGHFLDFASRYRVPTTIQMGLSSMYIEDRTKLAEVLTLYRENLSIESYDHTNIDVLHVAEASEGCVRVLSEWTDYNRRGAVIFKVQESYFLKPKGESWQIKFVEMLDEIRTDLDAGLPIRK